MNLRAHLLEGQVIPAHPLALTPRRTLDERRQVALTRYYMDAGAGGIAVGVHTTQFAIRDPRHGLFREVLQLAASTAREWRRLGERGEPGADAPVSAERMKVRPRGAPPEREIAPLADRPRNHSIARRTRSSPPLPFALIAGACGTTRQAAAEAETAARAGYHAVLLSLGGLGDLDDRRLLQHCRAVADILPLFAFYLQPSVGGRPLGHAFWRELAELPALAAVKIAPFNRYATLDVVRAVAEADRADVALYTGNDDNIIADLLTPVRVRVGGRTVERRIVGGLLGQWAVWTREAVAMLREIRRIRGQTRIPRAWLTRGAALTDANGAIFDASHAFAGCIPGIHEVLRRSGLLRGTWCLDPHERLSPGQSAEIDRVMRAWPELRDDDFVAAHRDRWMA